jgi:hypothetical protein
MVSITNLGLMGGNIKAVGGMANSMERESFSTHPQVFGGKAYGMMVRE